MLVQNLKENWVEIVSNYFRVCRSQMESRKKKTIVKMTVSLWTFLTFHELNEMVVDETL